LVAHWPKGIEGHGELRRTPGHVIDVVPTILELAGTSALVEDPKAPPAPGKSLVSSFTKDRALGRDYLWWSHDGNRAIRVEGWKLVATKDQPWELFNLAKDRAETQNLATQLPLKVNELSQLWLAKQSDFIKTVAAEEKPRKRK
jgi:arylsulfatase